MGKLLENISRSALPGLRPFRTRPREWRRKTHAEGDHLFSSARSARLLASFPQVPRRQTRGKGENEGLEEQKPKASQNVYILDRGM
jgi:hypothetical protein